MKTNGNDEYRIFINKILIILLLSFIVIFLYNILNIIIILFFSLFLVILFSPFLNKLNKWNINDFFGIIIIFLLLGVTISLVLFTIIPLVISQSISFFDSISEGINNIRDIYYQKGIKGFGLPSLIENSLSNLNIEQLLNILKDNTDKIYNFFSTNFKSFLTNGVGVISGFGSMLFNFVMVFIFTFFIVLERKEIRNFFYNIMPKKPARYILKNEKQITTTLSKWLKGQLIVGFSIFILTLIALLILKLFGINIEGILTLALIAGFMSFIPYIGTFISFFIAVIVSLSTGINAVIGVLIVYFIIQQIEGNLLVPFIMGKTLLVTPFSVLIGMLIGGSLFGIIGIILAVPFLSIINIFLKPYLEKRKNTKL